MNINKLGKIISVVSLISAISMNAATVNYTGPVSGSLGTAANFNATPTAADDVIVGTGFGVTTLGTSTSLSANSLTTSSGFLLSGSGATAGNLNVVTYNINTTAYNGFQGGKAVITGNLNVNQGTFELLDNVNTGANYTANGLGNLTVASGATLRLRLFSTPTGTSLTTGSLFDFSGVTFATGSNLTVSFEGTYAFANRTFNLFNAETLGNSGYIPTITFQNGGIGSTGSYNSTTGMYVLNAVPEPSTYLMMGLFSVILIGAAIRRKQSV